MNKNREFNQYREDAYSSDIIKLFNFDRYIGGLILSDIQNVERLLQNSIINTFAEIYKRWEKHRNMVKPYDLASLHKGTILRLSRQAWNIIFSHDDKEKPLKKEIVKKLKQFEDRKLIKKYNKKYYDMPIWSFIILLDFGTIIKMVNSFDIRCFDITMSLLNNGLTKKLKIDTVAFDTIFKNLKNVRNLICHSNVLYNYSNNKNLRWLNKFFADNSIKIKKLNAVRLFDVIELCNLFIQSTNESYSVYNYISKKVQKMNEHFSSKEIINDILNYVHLENYLKK